MCQYYRCKCTSNHLACSRTHLNRNSILHSHVLVHLKFLRHSRVLRRPLLTEAQKMSITSIKETKLSWSSPSRSRTVRFKCTVCCAWWLQWASAGGETGIPSLWRLRLKTRNFMKTWIRSLILINWFSSCNDSWFSASGITLTLHKKQFHCSSVIHEVMSL